MGKSRVLVFGSTGHIGRRLAKASLQLGHPTFLFISPAARSDLRKVETLLPFKRQGAALVEGSLDDHQSLIAAISKVDVVISALGESLLLKQLNIIHAIKEAGNVKRFLPSEFGSDPDRMVHSLEPCRLLFEQKRTVRRAVERAGIPYTYVSANCSAGYFLGGLGELGVLMPPKKEITLYGDGTRKVVWVVEEDIGIYSLRAADDPRMLNTTLYIRPPANVLSQGEVISMWEDISGEKLKRKSISEQDFLKSIQESDMSKFLAISYHVFYEGNLVFEIEQGEEASQLYPDVKYTSIHEYLLQFV